MRSQSRPASVRLNVSSPPKGRGFHVRLSETMLGYAVLLLMAKWNGELEYLFNEQCPRIQGAN